MEAFLGTILMWGPNFAPRGWAMCNGAILSIAQNTALFSLLGTTYGGDGQTTFALPNLCSRVPVGAGQGPGLSNYSLGQMGGVANMTLTSSNMPQHTHMATLSGLTVQVSSGNSGISTPVKDSRIAIPGSGDGRSFSPTLGFSTEDHEVVPLASDSISQGQVTVGMAGASMPLNIEQPYLAVNFIIALEGIFPSRQ